MELKSTESVKVSRVSTFSEDEESLKEETIRIAHHFTTVFSGYEGDDEVFIDVTSEKSATNMTEMQTGRIRRTSDVIDSVGDENLLPPTPSLPERYTSLNRAPCQSEVFFPSTFTGSTPASPITPKSDPGYSSSSAINSPLGCKWFRFNGDPPSSFTPSHASDVADANSTGYAPANSFTPASNTTCYIRKTLTITASTERESLVYNMNHKYRGIGLILNHKYFKPSLNLATRDGTEEDVKRLYCMYEALGLETRILNDKCHGDIMKQLHEISQENHTDRDCLVVTVLTHGVQSNFLWAYDVPYPITEIWNFFNPEECITLAGKPKIFFIQACRGNQTDAGISMVSRRFSETDSTTESYTVPRMADYFTVYSTPEGFYSWRNPEFGTWFIKALTEVFIEEHEKLDLSTMMLKVSHKVAIEYQSVSDNPSRDCMKQVPSTLSTLIRQVFFYKKI